MNTIARRIAVFSAVGLTTLPLAWSATRDVNNLTLLPGPSLLSPARGAPQSGPTVTIVPAWEIQVVRGPASLSVPNTSSLGLRPAVGTMTFSPETVRRPPLSDKDANPAPPAESLRFDAKLHAPAPPPQMQFVPDVKRQ